MLCSPVTHHPYWVQKVLPHVSHQLCLFSLHCWLTSLPAWGEGNGGRARHFIMARWKAIGDDSGGEGWGWRRRLGRIVSCRLTTETAVLGELEQSCSDNRNHWCEEKDVPTVVELVHHSYLIMQTQILMYLSYRHAQRLTMLKGVIPAVQQVQ